MRYHCSASSEVAQRLSLDQHQVRTWTSSHRWTVLSMLALALLTALAATERTVDPTPEDLIPVFRNEIHHLFTLLILRPIHNLDHHLRRSLWRRTGQT
jgi:hypothetical protein